MTNLKVTVQVINCDFSYFKDKAFFSMFKDNGGQCKNIIGGIVEEFSRRVGGGYSVNPWVGRCVSAHHTMVLFKTNIADFPTLFETEFRFLIPCLIKAIYCVINGNFMCLVSLTESRDGVVVIALPSHLHGRGSGHKCVKLVACSILCSERVFSGFSGFPLS